MQFCNKLDILMNITKTSNSALALYTSLDASHISRLRRGQRNAPKNEACIKNMAVYFTRHCIEEYQRKALLDVLNITPAALDEKELSNIIFDWLSDEKSSEIKTVERFLYGLSNTKPKNILLGNQNIEKPDVTTSDAQISVYYGISGKQQAVIQFLSEVLKCNQPCTLLLYSDEDIDWLTANREFTNKWAALMLQIVLRGNRIKIIHSVSRDLDEMLGGITHWMPLYMTGTIEPYFYPKKRDGIFKRTLFIAPGIAAVTSNSVGNMTNQAVNILHKDKAAIASFAEEYNQYLSLCKPLMRVFTVKDEEAYISYLLEFEKKRTNTIVQTESLSILTMPEVIAKSLVDRQHEDKSDLLNYHRIRTRIFEENIKYNNYIEVIKLPNIEDVIGKKVKISFSDMLHGEAAYYTAEEYIEHLRNIIHLLESYENFHVQLIGQSPRNTYLVYAKEDVGTLVARTTAPPVVLAINEDNLTAAFWDYLKDIIENKINKHAYKNESIKKIQNYIQHIKQHI